MTFRFVPILILIWVAWFFVAPGNLVQGEDWPQFLGPRRNGTSTEKGLTTSWPKKGPPLLWQREIGEGFSAPVIAKGKLILFHRLKDKEILECLNAKSGAKIWRFGYPCDYQDNYSKGNGPRSTPVISGDHVYSLGADGWLQCVRFQDGKDIWGFSIHKKYSIPENFFGVGTSPVVIDGKVLVNVGGKEAGIVAFDAETGKEIWKSTSDGASYSSPGIANRNEKKLAVFYTRYGVALVNPSNGNIVHRQKWKARYAASVNAATPLVINDYLFFSSSYETGALLLKLEEGKAKEIWKRDGVMSNHFNTCVYYQGHLFGFHGRQEAGPSLRCVELTTGKVKWSQKRYGCGSIILVDGKLIILNEYGDLVLANASPQSYQELAKAKVFTNPPCRAEIALADGRLYARDQSTLKCWDLKDQGEE